MSTLFLLIFAPLYISLPLFFAPQIFAQPRNMLIRAPFIFRASAEYTNFGYRENETPEVTVVDETHLSEAQSNYKDDYVTVVPETQVIIID